MVFTDSLDWVTKMVVDAPNNNCNSDSIFLSNPWLCQAIDRQFLIPSNRLLISDIKIFISILLLFLLTFLPEMSFILQFVLAQALDNYNFFHRTFLSLGI